MKSRFTWALVIVLGCVLYGSFGIHPASAGMDTCLRILPQAGMYKVGELVEIEIWIDNVADLYTLDLELSYPPGLLEAVDTSVTPDPAFFPADFTLFNTIVPQDGKVVYVATMLNPSPAVHGSGRVFSFQARVNAPGRAAIVFTTHDLIKAGAIGIDHTTMETTLTLLVDKLFLPLLSQ